MPDMLAKKMNAASRLTDAVDRFMRGLYDAERAADEIASAGLSFDDADFAGTSLAHLSAADVTTAISNVQTILADMRGASRDDVLNKVRP